MFLQGQSCRAYCRILKTLDTAGAKKIVSKPYVFLCQPAFIRKLLAVYREETGDFSEPTVIGGGTYARAMDNIVAFGPMFPGRELTEHQRNEYLLAEDFCRLRSIYRKAILALASD